MSKNALHFWILFLSSLLLATLAVSLVFKIVKALFFVLLLLVLTPLIYAVLKTLLSSDKLLDRSEKLKRRN